ncbi:hypothetical protein ASF57_18510 [Methylobacterium sp. Leaf117]|nr:hypothetical protein ASF57_18510 [Methylobacterium sp. Leaf117]
MTATYTLITSLDVASDHSEGAKTLVAASGDDVPWALHRAVWAPELQGLFGFPAYSVADLRGAIRRGELRVSRRGRLIEVSRRQLREWRDAWQNGSERRVPASSGSDDEASPISGTAPAASAPTASSAAASGSSCIAVPRSLALTAALAKVRNAKRSAG